MSQIDQAFIKAYHQLAGQPATYSRHDAYAVQPPPQQQQQTAAPAPNTGRVLRFDAGRSSAGAPAAARVPTPHLQVALNGAAWMSSATAANGAAASAGEAHIASERVSVVQDRVGTDQREDAVARVVQDDSRRMNRSPLAAASPWSPSARLGQRKSSASAAMSSAVPSTPASAPKSHALRLRALPEPPAPRTASAETAPSELPTSQFASIEQTLQRLEGIGAGHRDASASDLQVKGEHVSCIVQSPDAPETTQTPEIPDAQEDDATAEPEQTPAADAATVESPTAGSSVAGDATTMQINTVQADSNQQVESGSRSSDSSGADENPATPANPPASAHAIAAHETAAHETAASADSVTTVRKENLPTNDEEVVVESTQQPFQAVWEVDAFQWPEIVDRLHEECGEAIAAAARTIAGRVSSGRRILAVTGADDQAGATTLAFSLARGLVQENLQVALVDADFDHPVLAERLGVRVQDGWEATLAGKLPLEETCITSVRDGITLVPLAGKSSVSSTSASMNAAGQLRRMAEVFDVVLVDAGSGSENVAAIATASDEVLDVEVLLAVDQRTVDRDQANDLVGHLQQCTAGEVELAQTFMAV